MILYSFRTPNVQTPLSLKVTTPILGGELKNVGSVPIETLTPVHDRVSYAPVKNINEEDGVQVCIEI